MKTMDTQTINQFLNQELLRTNTVLDNFVYSCSHDLKGPLASIKGLIRLAEKSTRSSATDECLHLINESVVRMDNFLKSLESYVGNARGPVVRNEVDFQNMVEETINSRRGLINELNVKMNVRVRQQAKFFSDHMRISLILGNLIDNALFFQDPNKGDRFVDIEIGVNKEHVHIEICDNGEGIVQENIDKVFKMFFRASEASKGSGMGLYLVKEAVKKLSGSIQVVSSRGIGSNFVINLPNNYI